MFSSVASWLFFLVAALLAYVFDWARVHRLPKEICLVLVNAAMLTLLFLNEKKHLFVLFAFVAANLAFVMLIRKFKNARGPLVGLQAVLVFVFLFTFRFDFAREIAERVLNPTMLELMWPLYILGVSFVSFRVLSVSFDLWHGTLETIHLGEYLAFVTFFPTFISGPINRFSNFRRDLHRDHDFVDSMWEGTQRIVLGLVKKLVIADTLQPLTLDSVHASSTGGVPLLSLLIGHSVYVFVLYCDFSGYCDLAIGTARFFGIRVPENFNYPFLARNFQEFWGRWHITFMEWLRDYLLMPYQRLAANLGIRNWFLIGATGSALIFMVAGLWHGDTRAYFFYGAFNSAAAAVFLCYKHLWERLLSREQRRAYLQSRTVRAVSVSLTMAYFWTALLFFTNHAEVIWRMLGLRGGNS